MSDLNIRFSNCFDFINNTKQYLEANPTDWRNIYTMEDLAHAECDLMEMELEALNGAKEYDSVLNGNTFRSSKRTQRRKANIRHHKSDRKHGKPVPQSDKKYWDEQNGTFYRWDEKRKTFDSHKKPVIHRKRKTFRNRLNSAMDAREQEYISGFSEKGELMDKVLPTLEDNIIYLEKYIKKLEHEKTCSYIHKEAYSYINEKGKTILDEYEELLSKCEDYKKDILRVIHTATR